MNSHTFSPLAAALLLCLAGCYSLPTQSGTWVADVGSIVLHDVKGHACRCVVPEIKEGPKLKNELLPHKVVLVNSKLQTYAPEEIRAKRVRVSGKISDEFPFCALSHLDQTLSSAVRCEKRRGAGEFRVYHGRVGRHGF